MQCNSSTFNIHINKLRINQLELSLNHIYIEKAIGYYHTGESGLQNSLMILILNTIISKTRISLMNMSLYNFLKNNFVPISFITTHLIIYLFNYLHYILIFYISNYILHKWYIKHEHTVKHLYGTSTRIIMPHLILNILKNVNQQIYTHTNIQLYVIYYYQPYQKRYRDGL